MTVSLKWRAFAASVVGLFALAISINWYRRARLERTVKAWEELALDTTPQDEVDRKLRQLSGTHNQVSEELCRKSCFDTLLRPN
jgi:hypothetical protein